MLSAIVGWSVRRRRLVVAVHLLVALMSAAVATRLPVQRLPRLATREVVVRQAAPGLSPSSVEALLTIPLERGLAGTPGVAAVTSMSTLGLAVVTLEISPGARPEAVRAAVAERLPALSTDAPPGSQSPQISPLTAAGPPVRLVALSGGRDPIRLRDLAEWRLAPRVAALPGVGRVTLAGGGRRRVEVRGRPGDLADSDLGLLDLVRAAERTTSVAGAGFLDTPVQRVLVDPHGQAQGPDDIAQGQIQTPGAAPVRIGDVADVVEAAAPPTGLAMLDGAPAVLLQVDAQPGAEASPLGHRIDALIQPFAAAVAPEGIHVRLIGESGQAQPQGRTSFLAVAIAAILLLFGLFWAALRDVRASLVGMASVAASLLLTLAGLWLWGASLDAVTLGGLALALALMIDDTVLDLEFVLARVRSSRSSDVAEAVRRSSIEVRGPVFVGALLTAVAFLSLFALRGPEADALRPLALAALMGGFAAVTVAATLTPALVVLWVRPRNAGSGAPRMAALAAGYRKVASALRRPGPVLTMLGAATAALLIILLPVAAQPSVRATRLTAELSAAASLSPEAAGELFGRLSRDLARSPGLSSVVTVVGRDATETSDRGLGDATVTALPALESNVEKVGERLNGLLTSYPGVTATLRTRETAVGDGTVGNYRVDIFSDSPAAAAAYASKVAALLRPLKDAGSVRIAPYGEAPVARAELDFGKLALVGLSASDVLDTIQAAYSGHRVATIRRGDTPVDVVVTAAAATPAEPQRVGELLLRSTSGLATPLARVARVSLEQTPTAISRREGRDVVSVYANPSRTAVDAFDRAARATLAAAGPPPPGVQVSFPPMRQVVRARLRSLGALAAALAGGVLLLAFLVRNGRNVIVVLAAALFAMLPAAVAAILGPHALTLGVLAGLIAVFGLSARSALLTLSSLEAGPPPRGGNVAFDLALAAGEARVAPALLSAGVVSAAVLLAALAVRGWGDVLPDLTLTLVTSLVIGSPLLQVLLPSLVSRVWRPRVEEPA